MDVSELKRPTMTAKLPGPVVPQELYTLFMQACAASGLNQSEFVRGAVEFFLAEKFVKDELKSIKIEHSPKKKKRRKAARAS